MKPITASSDDDIIIIASTPISSLLPLYIVVSSFWGDLPLHPHLLDMCASDANLLSLTSSVLLLVGPTQLLC